MYLNVLYMGKLFKVSLFLEDAQPPRVTLLNSYDKAYSNLLF